jgi:flavorubredoxin
VKVLPLRASDRSELALELLDAGALLVGSPTLNNAPLPTVVDVLSYLKGLRPRKLVGAAFGSYGWSGEAVGQLEEKLRGMAIELAAEGLKVRYVPDRQALSGCRALGRQVGGRMAG